MYKTNNNSFIGVHSRNISEIFFTLLSWLVAVAVVMRFINCKFSYPIVKYFLICESCAYTTREIEILIYLSLFIFVQLIVFKMTPSEAKTFKHTVKCKLNDADKFTQV